MMLMILVGENLGSRMLCTAPNLCEQTQETMRSSGTRILKLGLRLEKSRDMQVGTALLICPLKKEKGAERLKAIKWEEPPATEMVEEIPRPMKDLGQTFNAVDL